jgi:hypothetical protein
MIPVLVAIASLRCFGIFVYRHHLQQHRKELLLMKRHAASYVERQKSAY